MEAITTPAMQRVIGALVSGEPVPEDARANLTDEERAEVARLTATAALTRDILQAPVPPPQAEEASLQRAQELVAQQRARTSLPDTGAAPRGGGVAGWLRRWRRRGS